MLTEYSSFYTVLKAVLDRQFKVLELEALQPINAVTESYYDLVVKLQQTGAFIEAFDILNLYRRSHICDINSRVVEYNKNSNNFINITSRHDSTELSNKFKDALTLAKAEIKKGKCKLDCQEIKNNKIFTSLMISIEKDPEFKELFIGNKKPLLMVNQSEAKQSDKYFPVVLLLEEYWMRLQRESLQAKLGG